MGISPEFFAHFANSSIEISTCAIHLIDESNTRNAIFIGLAPNGFGLWLHTGNRTKH